MNRTQVLLGEFLTLKRGYDLPERSRSSGEVPIVSSSGITGTHSEAKVDGPGVVTGRYGTLGQVFYLEEPFWPLNTALYVQDFKGNCPRFVSYFLTWIFSGTQSDKAAVPGVNRNDLHARRVLVPVDTGEQAAIANVLAAYDHLIENNRRRIQLLEQAAWMLYKEWFVHLRFPGHEHTRIIDGVLEGWTKEALGELLTLQRGFDLPQAKRKPGDIPIYASTGVNGYHDEPKVKGPGVVTGRSGSVGKVMYVSGDFWPLNTTLWIKEFKRVRPLFAQHLLANLGLEQHAGGAAVPTLNRNDLHRLRVLSPPIALLDVFEQHAHQFIRQAETLETMNMKLRKARDLLLPKLMSGELSV